MPKLTIICYKSKTYADGTCPIMIRICKDGKRKYQSLGITVHPDNWDFKENRPKENCPHAAEIMMIIQNKEYELKKTVLNKKIEGKDFTAYSLLHNETHKSTLPNNVEIVYRHYITELENQGRLRYAGMYKVSLNSFIKIMGSLDIAFDDIDAAWLRRYERKSAETGIATITIATRLRHLRAVFNSAITQKVVKEDIYPFKQYKCSKLDCITPKRALSKIDLNRIMNYTGKTDMERLALNLFKFSYFCAGINFIDMANLKAENIMVDKIVYKRTKTKKQIILPLCEDAKEIINYYGNKKGYIFPIFNDLHKTDLQKNNRLHKILAKINRDLRQIGEKLELPIKLTTYVARHSFATVLKRSGVATSIISETLGHSSEKITQVYLDSFENEQVKEAFSYLK